MPKFSPNSRHKLDTCDPRIVRILEEVIKKYDFTVVWGHRGKEAQNKAFEEGNSQKQWPKSRHNTQPSMAVDITPYPTMYTDIPEFNRLATYVFAEAMKQGVQLVWGGHWINFKDYAHWEIKRDEQEGGRCD